MNELANIIAMLAIGLVVGGLAGSVFLGSALATPAGSVSSDAASGTAPANHGSCVSNFVHDMLDQAGHETGIGAWVRAMAHRC